MTPTSPDPGSRSAALVGWLAAGLLTVAVIILQQAGTSVTQAAVAPAAGEVSPPDASLTMMAKLFVKMKEFLPAPPQAAGGGRPVMAGPSIGDQMEELARNDADRVRAAIVAIEIEGPSTAEGHLKRVEDRLPADSSLHGDIALLRELYRGSRPSESAQQAFVKRHAWFGDLAMSHGLPESDPGRRRFFEGGGLLIGLMLLFGLVVVVAMIAGLVLLIYGLIQFSNGNLRWKMDRPSPGGSLGVEMFAVFLLGFILLKFAGGAIASVASAKTAMIAVLAIQWLLMGVLAYPMLRGWNRREAWQRLGLHTGSGVFTEIGCGIAGYLASLPLLLVGLVISIVLMMIQAAYAMLVGKGPPAPPDNHLVELVGGTSTLELVMLVLLATVWAPIVEETIFRGAVYRQLRTGWWIVPAAIVSATLFALMHNYPVVMLPVLAGLATGFALIRQWRGSLIACMTAHFIHNAVAMTLLVTMTRLLDL